MRWPDIFFRSRKPKSPESSTKDAAAKSPSKVPSISELEKSVEPTPAKLAADKTSAESLRALKQSDTIRILPAGAKEAPPSGTGNKPTQPLNPVAAKSADPEPASPSTMPFRRKTKLTDVARILPKGDELPQEPAPETPSVTNPASSESPSVVPAAFPVSVTAGSVIDKKDEVNITQEASRPAEAPAESAAAFEKKDTPVFEFKPAEPEPALPPTNEASLPPKDEGRPLKDTTRVVLPESTPTPPAKESPPITAMEPVKTDLREKREFVLANGERILGHVLSETAETIYLDHHTLGVLTLPRTQIAKKPIEVILINGDRIVGDLIAETSECLYVRHASLGMLTVPHNQRSTRVVEAILKDGDRILGEVLAETDHFTVIRSATLGTVAVQHEQVAMLNRKIEQMQLRSLPAPAPALEDEKRD